MIGKEISKIELVDVESLIATAVSEGKTIEYKLKLPGNTDSDKKEFLADISSFANTSGGDLLFGIKEENGIPTKIDGVEVTDRDFLVRRYENLIRDGIEPRIVVSTKFIDLTEDTVVVLFRVQKSWFGPNRVIYKGYDKFFGRNSAGKYPLDTSELKTAFNLSQTLTDKVRVFREDRVNQIHANNLPLPFYETAKVILHIIPLSAFDQQNTLDMELLASKVRDMAPIYSSGWNNRVNLEGFLTYSGGLEDKSYSYVQLYRTGIIEAVDGLLLQPRTVDNTEAETFIPSVAFEENLLKAYTRYVSLLRDLDITAPLVIGLTLTGVKGYEMATSNHFFRRDYYPIDRDILNLPEILVEDMNVDAKTIMRPTFDLIWNACGYKGSQNFDSEGNWVNR